MLGRFLLYFKKIDWIIFLSVVLLVAFGLVEIYSVSLGRGGTDLLNFKKQILFIGVGFFLFFVFSFIDYHNWRNFSNYFYVLGLIMLISVLIFGQTINGTKGWFSVAGFGIQPVEFAKFFILIFLARYFSVTSLHGSRLRHLVVSGLSVALFFGLVMWQPDFGSAMLFFALWLFMIMLVGFDKKYLLVIFLSLAVLFSASWFFYLKPYQKERLVTFLNPTFDPLKQGYNVAQAIIAIGAGGVYGRGVGFGSQSQLKFLPESQTDFIFAVIAEELGFLGVILILGLFAIFFYRGLANLRKINNDFGVFFILGAMSLLFIEMFINIGMNIGILPVVGIALPFLSYGGSAMLTNLMIVGVMESIIARSKNN